MELTEMEVNQLMEDGGGGVAGDGGGGVAGDGGGGVAGDGGGGVAGDGGGGVAGDGGGGVAGDGGGGVAGDGGGGVAGDGGGGVAGDGGGGVAGDGGGGVAGDGGGGVAGDGGGGVAGDGGGGVAGDGGGGVAGDGGGGVAGDGGGGVAGDGWGRVAGDGGGGVAGDGGGGVAGDGGVEWLEMEGVEWLEMEVVEWLEMEGVKWLEMEGWILAASQIVTGPATQSIHSGDEAVFNCSLRCTEGSTVVTWYLMLPLMLRKISISPYTSPSQVKSMYGLDLSRNTIDDCSSGGYHIEQLLLSNITKDFDLMPIQCAVLCIGNGCGCTNAQVLFSTVAVVKLLTPTVTDATSVWTPSSASVYRMTPSPTIGSGSAAFNVSWETKKVIGMDSSSSAIDQTSLPPFAFIVLSVLASFIPTI
ncbi:hypothetical protein EMCRGX_G015438 [Ephydatia muelleri]